MFWTILAVTAVVLILLPNLFEWFRRPVSRDRADVDEGGFARLSDGETYCRWYGNASEHVVVLIHGLTTPHWVFTGLTRGLNMLGYQVLAYDLYGRGLSDRPSDHHTPQFYVRQLTDLLDEMELDQKVMLMGYSMGGVIASLFATTYPERVSRLVLLAPGGIAYTPKEPLRTAGRTGTFGKWLWLVMGERALNKAGEREAWQATVIPDIDQRIKSETARRGYLRAVLSAHRETLGIDLEDVHRDLARLEIPVLAIWGEEDEIIPAQAIGKLTLWNRNAIHHVVEGAGHSLPHTAPNEIIKAVAAFVKDTN